VSHPLLTRARTTGAPITTGDQATFLWEGARPPQLIGDFNGWDTAKSPAWQRVAPGLWSYTLDLPGDAYIEYGFTEGDDPDGRIPDPFNGRTTPNGVGQINHFFYMPEAGPTPLAQRVRGVQGGTVTRHVVEHKMLVTGGRRAVWLYQPATPDPSPLVVVYDGADYYRRGRLTQIVDNLIAQGRIRPIALALVENGGQARVVEYACSDATIGFVMECVLPLAADRLRLIDASASPGSRGGYGILGASMGGLMALYTGLRAPQVFGHVLSQSGAFWQGPMPWVVTDLVRDGAVRPVKIWMDAGRYEWLLPGNRAMHALLKERGYDVTYREFNGGHNYPAWRDDVWRGLEHLYPADENG
jgi:enterochelin esterase-like enzyme